MDSTDIRLRNNQDISIPLATNEYVKRATADNTRKAYRQDIRHFEAWGGRLPTNTATVIRYLQEHATSLNPRTLKRRLVSIKQFHCYQGFSDPTEHPLVSKTLRGIKNTHGQPKRKAPAMTLELMKTVIDSISVKSDLAAIRNRAMITLGFFAALRGSELVSVQVEHVKIDPEGLTVHIPRSKTDPSGEGQSCSIPILNNTYCPIKAIQCWIEQSGIQSGCLFRGINQWQQILDKPLTVDGFNGVLRRVSDQAGLIDAHRYSSHSLRRGLATSASASGASFKSIMQQGRWRHEGTVLEYIEDGQKYDNNAVSSLFEAPT